MRMRGRYRFHVHHPSGIFAAMHRDRATPGSATGRWLRAGAQVVLIGGAVLFLVRTAKEHSGTLTSWQTPIDWATLAAASVLVIAAFVFMVMTWAVSLRWWRAALPFLSALRIWSLSNLARFIPGAVWQFAGLAALAADEGISPLAATGAVLLQQLVLLGTGVVIAVMLAPAWIEPISGGLSPVATAGIAVAALVALTVAIPLTMPALGAMLGRVTRREFAWPRPSLKAFATYTSSLVLPWLAYAVAFWLFARAVVGSAAPSLAVSGGAFVASYVAGIIAVFAPAGLAVREAALVAMLTPVVDARTALVLAIGSRLWMIALEIITAMVIVVAYRARRSAARDAA
jgi:hypothetical protein